MERVLRGTIFGDTVYPDCANAGEIQPSNDCLCNRLTESEKTTYYCGTAVTAGKCPLGKKPQ